MNQIVGDQYVWCRVFALLCAAAVVGCSDPPPEMALASISVAVGPGDAGAACKLPATDWLEIKDGEYFVTNHDILDEQQVNIFCTVQETGPGLRVSANIALLDGLTTVGGIAISGDLVEDGTGIYTDISANFSRDDIGTFQSRTCTLDFNANPKMEAQPGRLFAMLHCPVLTSSELKETCVGVASINIQNCGQ